MPASRLMPVTDTAQQPDSAGGLQVVARSAQILRMLDSSRSELRINDVADHLRIGRTSAHRYLQSMAVEGFLQRVGDGSYRLGPLLTALGASMLSKTRAVEVAEPFLTQLADSSGETTALGIWTGSNAVAVLCKEPAGKTVNMTVRTGAPLPVDSAQGICFLAYLDDEATTARALHGNEATRQQVLARMAEVRANGYAVSAAVLPGVGAIAAPVFDSSGSIVATVAIISSLETFEGAQLETLVRPMVATAKAVSLQLGFTGHGTVVERQL